MIEVNYNEYKETITENMELIQKNHKLQERIEKAIEYINKHTNNLVEYLDVVEVKDLLEILKGESK